MGSLRAHSIVSSCTVRDKLEGLGIHQVHWNRRTHVIHILTTLTQIKSRHSLLRFFINSYFDNFQFEPNTEKKEKNEEHGKKITIKMYVENEHA